MKLALLIALATAACASPAPQQPSKPPAGPAATPDPSSAAPAPRTSERPLGAEEAATRFFEAFLRGDKAGMKSVALTHAELAQISKRAPPAEEYDKELDSFLDGRVLESKDAPPGTRLERVEVEKTDVLKASESEKLLRDLSFAVVAPVFVQGGQTRGGIGLLFVETPSGFKLSIRN